MHPNPGTGKSAMPEVLGAIQTGATLKPVDTADRSAPNTAGAANTAAATRRKSESVHEQINAGGHALRPVGAKGDDRSAPLLEPGSGAKPNPAVAVMAEIGRGASLKKVGSVSDRSAPAIEAGTKVEACPRPALLADLKKSAVAVD